MNDTYDSRGWLVPPKPHDVLWKEYGPKRIRPFRSPPRKPSTYWIGCRPSLSGSTTVVIRQESDGPSREWLAERDAAGHATKRDLKGTRIERILVEEKSPHIITLRRIAELMRPPVIASNDNEPHEEGEEKSAGSGFERIHNQGCILPSIPVLLRAYAPKIETSQRQRHGGWLLIGKSIGHRKLIGLIFQNGELVAYGDDKSRRCKPRYDTKLAEQVVDEDSETAKHVAAQSDENTAYTRMNAAGTYMSAQSPTAPRALEPAPRTARAIANDNILTKAVANTKVMPKVKRLPDGVAADYGRLAGIAELKGVGDGKTTAPRHEVLEEMDRSDALAAAGLLRADLDVIEDVLADASFRTIGLQRGYADSSASRMGRKVVEDALKRISTKIAA